MNRQVRGAVVAGVALATAAAAVWLLVRRPPERVLPVYWQAPSFSLVNQLGDTLRSADLAGTVWVVSFVFTNCTGVCPLITSKMAQLRDSLAAGDLVGRDVRLVSITVDPARDTPDALRRYAARFGGSPPEQWAFLTGTPAEAVRRLIQEGFKVTAALDTSAQANSKANYQVQHTPRIMLVDRKGRIRGAYHATEPDVVATVIADLRTLVSPR